MRGPKEDQPKSGMADGCVFRIFLGVKESLEQAVIPKSHKAAAVTHLLYDQSPQAVADKYDFRTLRFLSTSV